MLPLDFILYLQIIIFLFITPGTPRIVIISYSMNYGVGKCIWSALGDVTANLIQATLVIFVIGSFFSENSMILNAFKWIGIVYLLYLAYDIYKSRPKNISNGGEIKKSKLIACPGCYPTSVLIPLIPILNAGLIKNKNSEE